VSVTIERGGELFIEQVALSEIAERFGTPCYVYSKALLVDAFEQYRQAFGAREHLILYAVKANSNLAILKLLGDKGCGFDIVSGGELERVLRAGGDRGRPRRVPPGDAPAASQAAARRDHAARRQLQRQPGFGACGDRRARGLPGPDRSRAR